MTWPNTVTLEEARKLQNQMRGKIRISPLKKDPIYVAGVDAAFSDDRVFAAACLDRYPELTLMERRSIVQNLLFPYIPGFLSFREGPAIIAAVEKLSHPPDLILVDGQGIAHPRGVGIASFIGVTLGVPAIGCAKSRLIGEYEEPGKKKGSWSLLLLEDQVIGAVLRSRDSTRPLFISPGHKTDLSDSIRLTLACTGVYRIPEPLRCADMLSRKNRNDSPSGLSR